MLKYSLEEEKQGESDERRAKEKDFDIHIEEVKDTGWLEAAESEKKNEKEQE